VLPTQLPQWPLLQAKGLGSRNPLAAITFYVTLIDTSNNIEIVKVTARSTDTFTIVRGQDGTSGTAFSASTRVELRPTAALIEEAAAGGYLETASIPDGVVTLAKVEDATQECLLGTAAAGDFEEITIGTGLEISGGALNATVSGSKIIRNWLPTDASFPASGYATLDTRNTHPVLDFDDSAFESAYFHGVMPDNYETDADVVVEVYYAMTSATSGAINFAVRLENMIGLDIDTDSFASYGGFTNTVPSTAGQVKSAIATLTLASTQLDSLTAGDLFRLHVARNGADGSDTATGDAEVLMVEMRIA
jgi:hypothetical protein